MIAKKDKRTDTNRKNKSTKPSKLTPSKDAPEDIKIATDDISKDPRVQAMFREVLHFMFRPDIK